MKLNMLNENASDTDLTLQVGPYFVWATPPGNTRDRVPELFGSLSLSREGNGVYAAALPVSIPTDREGSTALQTLSRLEVSANTSVSRNGVRRLLLRVAMPYFSLDPASYGKGVKQLSTARSQHSMTAHIVVTIPREMEQDVKGMYTADAGAAAADAQLGCLLDILRALLGCSGTDLVTAPSATAADLVSQMELVGKQGTIRQATCVSNAITGYRGQSGLKMTCGNAALTSKGENPLARAILGLQPLTDEAIAGPVQGAQTEATFISS